MIAGLTLFKVFSWFRGSLIAQIAAGAVALLGIWQINNAVVARKAVAKVVENAKKDGRKRNAQAAKVRRNIDPASAWKRLQRDYAGPR